MPRARERLPIPANPTKSPLKIPLNDDRQEKASRLQSRQALHERQMNEIKAAASTPQRRPRPVGTDSPLGQENESDPIFGNNANTPLKRVPLLANFEEWMRMATDNKINANNSWNFALIDYFYDMSLLKEGDGVNFQKASCTLDGCVKIYTSRVDSVATETGKLLSGLADSRNKNRKDGDSEQDDNQSESEEGEEGEKRPKKRTQRSSEATLVSSFSQLQLKKMELEFAVDPLFKKASADFDEGGAKGLLLNNLTIDGQGKIVFDSSDDVQDISAGEKQATPSPGERPESSGSEKMEGTDININMLASKFFPDLERLDEKDICPSLKNVDFGDANGSLELPFLKNSDVIEGDQKSGDQMTNQDNTNAGEDFAAFNDDDDDVGALGDFDLPLDTGFGEGGEAWAKHAALNTQMRLHNINLDEMNPSDDLGGDVGAMGTGQDHFAVALSQRPGLDAENILNYFDKTLEKNWAGPEHWKIRKIKENAKSAAQTTVKRKEKEPFEIDFAAPLTQAAADALYLAAPGNSTISLPKAQWTTRTRNLLPDDKHFNSRQLLRLFLKPRARIGAQRSDYKPREIFEGVEKEEVSEQYWAKNAAAGGPEDENAAMPDYDANFFQDDGLSPPGGMDDNDDFADAREVFSTPADGDLMSAGSQGDGQPTALEGTFGAQLVTQSRRVRPEYVQYARVAKKVDVRRLKEELWKGIGYEHESTPETTSESAETKETSDTPKDSEEPLKFTHLMNDLQKVYPPQLMADISTSYCFICLLHLANEKGLVLNHEQDFQELMIRKDFSAEVSEVPG